MKICYTYDKDGVYQGESPDYGLLPNNATYTKPILKDGYVPVWDTNSETWSLEEDHRGMVGWIGEIPTFITKLGKLPENFSLTPPLPDYDSPEERARAINIELRRIDEMSIRPLRAVQSGTATVEDMKRLKSLQQVSEALRHELALINKK